MGGYALRRGVGRRSTGRGVRARLAPGRGLGRVRAPRPALRRLVIVIEGLPATGRSPASVVGTRRAPPLVEARRTATTFVEAWRRPTSAARCFARFRPKARRLATRAGIGRLSGVRVADPAGRLAGIILTLRALRRSAASGAAAIIPLTGPETSSALAAPAKATSTLASAALSTAAASRHELVGSTGLCELDGVAAGAEGACARRHRQGRERRAGEEEDRGKLHVHGTAKRLEKLSLDNAIERPGFLMVAAGTARGRGRCLIEPVATPDDGVPMLNPSDLDAPAHLRYVSADQDEGSIDWRDAKAFPSLREALHWVQTNEGPVGQRSFLRLDSGQVLGPDRLEELSASLQGP